MVTVTSVQFPFEYNGFNRMKKKKKKTSNISLKILTILAPFVKKTNIYFFFLGECSSISVSGSLMFLLLMLIFVILNVMRYSYQVIFKLFLEET